MKNLSVKKLVGIGVGAAAALAVVALAAVFALRVDSAEARQIALDAAGGGEVVAQEVSSEGLWNEYSYEIVNGDTWYDIEAVSYTHLVLDIPPERIVKKSRLQPGRMLLADLTAGRLVDDAEVKDRYARQQPYGCLLYTSRCV